MPPKQATLGYVKDNQTTLRTFFGKPIGAKLPPAKQAKLALSSNSVNAQTARASDRPMKDDGVAIIAGTSKPEEDIKLHKGTTNSSDQIKKEDDSNSQDDIKPTKNYKKRIRSPNSKQGVKEEDSEEEDEDQDEDDEPVSKRPRRRLNTTKYSPVKGKARGNLTAAKKDKSMPSPPKHDVNTEIKDEAPAVAPSKAASEPSRGSTVSASTSEVENRSENDESDEDDEQPQAAAKAREKVQTTLKAKSKDPYPDWKPGEPVPYAALCTTFSLIEMTSKRLIIASHCSLFLRQVLRLTPDDLLVTVLLMINKLAADYAGIELGIGESLIMKAIGETTGRSLTVIKQDQKEIGDLGLVAVKSKSKQPTMFKPKALSIRGVHRALIDIATVQGSGAQGRKVDGIKKLLSAADGHVLGKVDITKDKGGPSEAKFIIRFLEGKLRLGLAEKTVLTSLAQAMVVHEIDARESGKVPSTEKLAEGEAILKSVHSSLPSYDVIIPAMLENGLFSLKDICKLQPGVPLKPMLAKPTKAITEVLDRFENQTFTCEYKYDGERAQIHYVAKDSPQHSRGPPSAAEKTETGLAAIFSRNSEDLSKKYPDILAKLDSWVNEDTKSFVLDCETVAWDLVEKKVLPFQQLMTRKKKDVKVEDVKVKVCVFAFDMLFLNGQAVVERPLRERRDLLHAAFTPREGEFAFATSMNGQEIDEIQTFLDESVKASCEGLMVKMLDGTESGYEPSKRSRNWLKIKKDYLSGIGDSLDLVVLGAYFGKGKRTSFYGSFLLACHNTQSETYETICNIGTGFSEADLETLHAQLEPLIIHRPKPFYEHSSGGQHQPDVWFEAKYVWEVRTADLTLSPRYKAAIGEGVWNKGEAEKGVSLRFPRFLRVRNDKKAAEATSSRQVADMYRKQEGVAKGSKGKSADDDYEY